MYALTQLWDLDKECEFVFADRCAYAYLNSITLSQWYRFRCLEGARSGASPEAIGPGHDVFPVGSIVVDKSLSRVLFRKVGPLDWCRTDELVTDLEIRTAKLKIVQQHRYEHGPVPSVSLVWYNTLLSEAKDGVVEFAEEAAFDGVFVDRQQKEKFTSRLLFLDKPPFESKQRNLHRKGGPITRAELAKHVSADVEAVLESGPLSIDGKHVGFEDLILVDVRCVSRGSVQATLAIRYFPNGPLF